MSEDAGHAVKPSELFRERLVARYYNAMQRLPDFDTASSSPIFPDDFVPQSSSDTALTAFAQLTALRLDVTRVLISLIDSRNQYVLAEATRTLSMQSDQRHGPNDALWLGSVVIPRNQGICELVLESPENAHLANADRDQAHVTILQNLQQHPKFRTLPRISGTTDLLFYAGVPISLPDGTKIGAYCLFDNKLRADLSVDQKSFLRDMAKTTMEHLEAVRLRAENERRHKLVNGLESFIDGLAGLKSLPYESGSREQRHSPDPAIPARSDTAAENTSTRVRDDPLNLLHPAGPQPATFPPMPLWESTLPVESKPMFSRAANIIRQSGDYDGVVFFYLSSALTRTRFPEQYTQAFKPPPRRQSSPSRSTTISSSPSSSGDSDPLERAKSAPIRGEAFRPELVSPRSPCPVLSVSLDPREIAAHESSNALFSDFTQYDLDRLLGRSPRGQTFILNQYGQPLPGDTSSSSSSADQRNPGPLAGHIVTSPKSSDSSKTGRYKVRSSQIRSLRKLSPAGRSFVCSPLWDFERQRWFAYGVCWSNTPNRDPGMDGDLHFLRIFGNSIMNAHSYIDATAANRAKTNFVSLISHELRSPLHGILGATKFLQDSSLDGFQQEMVDSISNSGRTLLDTVDHVMDFANINTFAPPNQQMPSAAIGASNTEDNSLRESALSSTGDIVGLLEEVVDTVFMGFSVRHDFIYPDEGMTMSHLPNFDVTPKGLASSSKARNQRGRVMIALQIPFLQNWRVKIQTGAWRRIIMNLFGNALKYTTDGLIIIRLQPVIDVNNCNVTVCLSVIDTGKGMSKDFLENRIFLPFSQEDPFASGTGLGLNIVHQVVRAMGGKIDVSSSSDVGTTIAVELTMRTADSNSPVLNGLDLIDSVAERVQGMRICILDSPYGGSLGDAASVSADRQFLDGLSNVIKDWFGIEATVATSWSPGSADIVIFLRPSFKHLESIRRHSVNEPTVPAIIIIAYDALEMAALRADARIAGEISVVETIAQPIGPRKLARSFEQCLERRQTELMTKEEKGQKTLPSRPLSLLETSKLAVSSAASEIFTSYASKQPNTNSIEVDKSPAVLIVDDNKLNLRLLGVLMKKLAMRYYEATNGQEAVHLYVEAKGSIQCVLMDISMPVMDGMTATRLIREFERISDFPRATIVALTGLASTAARLEAQEAGMDDFLIKPISFSMLHDILHTRVSPNHHQSHEDVPPRHQILSAETPEEWRE